MTGPSDSFGESVPFEMPRPSWAVMAPCLRETVERHKAMTQEERDAELLAIAELDRRRR